MPVKKFENMKIVLATQNRDKIRELRNLLNETDAQILTLDDFPGLPEVHEDGETLEANAEKKAYEIYHFTGYPALADDTGLEVKALNGAPGVYSSRYAGEDVTYAENVAKLLKEMNNIPPEQREACFRTVMVYLDDHVHLTTEGRVDGKIMNKPAGTGGFGYDPVFYYPPYGKTLSEITPAEKNRISHRGKALALMIRKLCEHQLIREV
jgi:XTP/dITP diphosphohydrolase